MSSIRPYWQSFVNTGIRQGLPEREQVRYRVFNRTMVVAMILFAILAINAGIAGRGVSVAIQLFRVFSAAISILLIRKYGISIAAISVLIWNTTATCLFLYLLPFSIYSSPTIFVEYLLVFYFFPRKHLLRNVLATFVLISAIVIVVVERIKEPPTLVLALISVVSASIIYFIFLQLFTISDQKYEEELKALNTELEEGKQQMAVLFEQERQRREELEHLHQALEYTQQNLLKATQQQTLQGTAASIMHGINNPLNYIVSGSENIKHITNELTGVLEKLMEAHEQGEALGAHFQQLQKLIVEEEAINDLAELSHDVVKGGMQISHVLTVFRTLSEIRHSKFRTDNIKIAIESAFKRACEITHAPEATLHIDTALTSCYLDHDMLEEALLHLFKNSIEAQAHSKQQVYLLVEQQENKLVLQIIDQGDGVPTQHWGQIFEPFFSTKARMGLGLTLVKSLIEAMNGELSIEAHEGQSAFVIRLPQEKS